MHSLGIPTSRECLYILILQSNLFCKVDVHFEQLRAMHHAIFDMCKMSSHPR
jgi:hypothetical protein